MTVKNLFVTDGAAFVTIGCVNPTLTMMALARRASEYLVEALKLGELAWTLRPPSGQEPRRRRSGRGAKRCRDSPAGRFPKCPR